MRENLAEEDYRTIEKLLREREYLARAPEYEI
jgi:hypothetical protein